MHLIRRITKAFNEGKKFRVIVILPLEPAFSGEVKSTQSIKTILKYTYRTISRNDGKSLIEKLLENLNGKYQEYISFFSLRNHAVLNGIPKQEMIYIHAKLLLVDDKKLIIGSANINDRSMLGDRDSELAVLCEGGEQKTLNGREVSSLVFNLRMRMLSVYLNIPSDSDDYSRLLDPLNEDFWSLVNQIAYKNTKIYRDVFKCYPDDIFTSLDEFKYSHFDTCTKCLTLIKENYLKLSGMIQGLLIEFPLNYLKDENLDRGFSKEKVLPVDLFL